MCLTSEIERVWHCQCAKKLLALRLRILRTIIDIKGPQTFQSLRATSQFKRQKGDMKRISYDDSLIFGTTIQNSVSRNLYILDRHCLCCF